MAEPTAELARALAVAVPGRVRTNEPLARHTSFRIGGPADILVSPDTAEELGAMLRVAAARGVAVTMVGGGSNMLVGDAGIRGVVVKLGRGFRRVAWEEPCVRAGAAVQLGRLAREAVDRGLAGLEYAEGIPGTVGGALFMNAGAYGGDLAATVAAVEGLEATGAEQTIAAA
ncbi:MAG: FAD-binding protein, partial [Candidatus Binatia bacterium]